MRDGWRKIKLGEMATRRRDFTPVVADTLYRVVGVQRSGWGLVDREPVRGDSMKFGKLLKLRSDDLVYRTITAFEAPSAVVPTEFEGAFVTPQTFPTYAIDRSQLLPGYMSMLTTAPAFHEAMSTRCVGSVLRRKTLSQSAFESIPIALPPIEEQRRMVDLIATVDDAVQAAEAEADATLGALGAERARVFGHPNDSVLAGEAFDVVIGKQKSADKVDGSNVIPYLRSANVELGRIRVDDVLAMHFSERDVERLALRDGDVLITEGSASEVAVGVPAVWRGELGGTVGIQNALIRVRAVPDISTPEFAEHWAFWAYESGTFREIANGTNIKHVGVERARLVRVPKVDIAEQPRLVAHMSAMRDAAHAAHTTADALRTLRANLLTVLLSGEHQIPTSYDALLEEATP